MRIRHNFNDSLSRWKRIFAQGSQEDIFRRETMLLIPSERLLDDHPTRISYPTRVLSSRIVVSAVRSGWFNTSSRRDAHTLTILRFWEVTPSNNGEVLARAAVVLCSSWVCDGSISG